MICLPIFISGLSDVIGSWKIIDISRPQRSRIWAGDAVDRLAALEADRSGPVDVGADEQPHDRA